VITHPALGTSPDVWMGLQQDVDLWDALQTNKVEYGRIKPLRAA
jgi:plasmid maintenance system antidote protein VapI